MPPMTPKFRAAERYFLELASEDYTDIADLFVFLRLKLDRMTDAECMRQAEVLLRGWVDAGLLTVFYDDRANATANHRPVRELSPEEVDLAFAVEANWLPAGLRNSSIGVFCTLAGMQRARWLESEDVRNGRAFGEW